MRDGMDNAITDWEAGMTAPADGNAGADARGIPHSADSVRSDGQQNQVSQGMDLGPNFERLEEERPELVNALRELVRQYRQEGVTARRPARWPRSWRTSATMENPANELTP